MCAWPISTSGIWCIRRKPADKRTLANKFAPMGLRPRSPPSRTGTKYLLNLIVRKRKGNSVLLTGGWGSAPRFLLLFAYEMGMSTRMTRFAQHK